MDLKAFQSQLYRALTDAFSEVVTKYPDVYGFALVCSDDLRTLRTAANTLHYLHEQADPDSGELAYVKFNIAEWGVWEGADEAFRRLSAQLSQALGRGKGVFVRKSADTLLRADILEACMDTLRAFAQSDVRRAHPAVFLDFQMPEAYMRDTRPPLFDALNPDPAIQAAFRESLS